MSSRMVNARCDLCDAAEQRRSVFVPAGAIPQLQTVAGSHHDDLLAELRMLAQEAGNHDPPGSVELGVVRAPVEEALELRQPRGQRRQLGQRALGVALVVLRAPNTYIWLEIDGHREHHALRQGCAIASRGGGPGLRVERVVEGAAEGHWGLQSS